MTPQSSERPGPATDENLVEVFETHDLGEFDVARGLLESAGIRVVSRGDVQARLLGLQLLSSAFERPSFIRRAGALILLVAPNDAAFARELLASEVDIESTPELAEEDEP